MIIITIKCHSGDEIKDGLTAELSTHGTYATYIISVWKPKDSIWET
jgi:hypothetical protein